MAIENKIGDFALLGIHRLLIYTMTKDLVGEAENLLDLKISDSQAKSDLRGGFGAPKILTVYGDRETTLTATTATLSPEILEIITNQKISVKTEPIHDKEVLTIAASKVTLSQTPKTGEKLEVYRLENGKRVAKLTPAESGMVGVNEYKISGQDITFNAATTGDVAVFYVYEQEREVFEAKGGTPQTYFMVGKCVAKDIKTGYAYLADIEIPKATISPSYELGTKNSAEAPDTIPIELDMLVGDKGYPYKLSFVQEA